VKTSGGNAPGRRKTGTCTPRLHGTVAIDGSGRPTSCASRSNGIAAKGMLMTNHDQMNDACARAHQIRGVL
jgi:hypothetical protein